MMPRAVFHKVWVGALLMGSCALAGCQKAPEAHFHLNMMAMAEGEMNEDNQKTIANILLAMFGTPDEPFVIEDEAGGKMTSITKLDRKKLMMAAGPVRSDQSGAHT